MKINILFDFEKGPSGGGNKFLTILKGKLEEKNVYEENIEESDIIIINGNPSNYDKIIKKIYCIKKKHPEKIIIQRMAGPIFLCRNKDFEVDKIIYFFNKIGCEGTIFQSNWSEKENKKNGLNNNNFEKIIYNVPDTKKFFKSKKSKENKTQKIKLIASSWSSNENKGFSTYEWLDNNLDFSKYEMNFIGNSPIKFKNIKILSPVNSEILSEYLMDADIYISASRVEACSNAILEAIYTGLPCVIYSGSSNPEIIKNNGKLFNDANEIEKCIENIYESYESYTITDNLLTLDDTAQEYYSFCKKVYTKYKNKEFSLKKIKIGDYVALIIKFNIWIYKNKFIKVIKRLECKK